MRVERRRKNMVVLGGTFGKVSRTKRMFVSREEVRRQQAGRATIILVALIAILSAIFGVLKIVTDISRPEIENQLPGVSSEAANYNDNDALTLAVIKLDDDSIPEKLVLTRFEPSEERIYVSGVPLDTIAGDSTLAEHYAAGGDTALEDALEELTDCDRVFVLKYNYIQLRKLINYYDGVKLTLDYGIDYTSPNNDRNLNVVAGTRLFTGWEIARLLNYPDWEGGESEHLYMYAYVLSEFFGQNFKGYTEKSLQKFFGHVCAYSNNDISTNTFHLVNAGLLHLSDMNDGDISMLVELKPTQNSDGRYIFEGDELLLLQAVFGDRDPEK